MGQSWSGSREPMDPINVNGGAMLPDDNVDHNIVNGALLPEDHVESSPSSGERPSKRLRRSPSGNDTQADSDAPVPAEQHSLPPEVWSDVMKFLPLSDILTCGAVSRSLLHETMPLLTLLRIDKASQMHLGVASRFRDVTDIHINSLMKGELMDEGTEDEMRDIMIDFETRIKSIPFISRFLPTLERIHFGGKDENGRDIEGFDPADAYFWEGEDIYPNDGPWANMKAFIDMLSGAFGIGAFSSHLKISGLTCPNNGTNGLFFGSSNCATCQRACKSFPLESVVAFESKGSSSFNAVSGRPCGLDVCLPVAEIESIIESRPGGKELLRSDARLLRLLGCGRRWELKSDDNSGRALLLVKFTQAQLDEIKRVIQYAELDVKQLSPQKVHEAVSKSFLGGRSLPQNSPCHLSDESLLYLKDEVGLFIDTSRLCVSSSDIRPHLKSIVNILVECFDEESTSPFRYEAILSDCFKLLRRLLEFESDIAIEGVNDAIPCLAKELEFQTKKENQIEAASALGIIFAKGTEEQRKQVIDAGVIPKFTRILNSSEDSVTKIALLGLVDILVGEKKEHVDAMVNAGGIPKLVELLHSSDDVRVKGSHSLLVIAASDHIQDVIDAKAHDSLFRMILSDDQVENLPKCSILLRKIFEVDNPPIQQAIEANLVSRLVQILKRSQVKTVDANLAFVCISLASLANEDNIESLTRDTGLLPLLVGLQDSSIEAVSVQAATCLDHIANIQTSFDVECEEPLSWGEYRVLDLVDSDDDSAASFEEALEVSDEQVELEEQQAMAANASIRVYQADLSANAAEVKETPSLLGIPRGLLQTILIYATETQTELNILANVCRKFYTTILGTCVNDEVMTEIRARHPSHRVRTTTVGLRNIRKFQHSVENEIEEVICDKGLFDGFECFYADELHKLAANILARMNPFAAPVSFRLRGDTVFHLVELLQSYMVKRLEDALLMAVHCYRTEVQGQDFVTLSPSLQSIESKCDVVSNYHGHGVEGLSFLSTCSLPSSSGTVWRWPENDCRDVLPPDVGRRIIRRLAYKAGIVRLTGDAFEAAEAELLHTLGILLVEAYEASVVVSKTARFLGPEEVLPYKLTARPGSIDMFYVPPPPLTESLTLNDEESGSDNTNLVYTIVPGQISAAAQRRNIGPHDVYGGWCISTDYSSFDDMLLTEEGYYYKDHRSPNECDSTDSDSSSNTVPIPPKDSSSGNEETLVDDVDADDSHPNANHDDAAPAPAAAADANAANAPQPQPARNGLDTLRTHRHFNELRRRFQNGFSSAESLLRDIIQQHPELRDAIDSNQAAFYDLMSP